MRRKRLTGSKILAKLRGVDELLAKGVTEDNAIREFRISKRTYDHWRREYDGMDPEAIDKLLSRERESRRLKKLVFEDSLKVNEIFVLIILGSILIVLLLWMLLGVVI